MKILSLIFAVCLVISNITVSHASPLVFKVTKEVTTTDLVELGNFDASKYRQVRIAVKQTSKSNDSPLLLKSVAEIQLNAAKRDLERQKGLLEQGSISRANYDIYADQLKIAQANYDNSVETVYPPLTIYAIEGTEETVIASFDRKNFTGSIVIDSPPTKIGIKVFGKGTYKVFAWASL